MGGRAGGREGGKAVGREGGRPGGSAGRREGRRAGGRTGGRAGGHEVGRREGAWADERAGTYASNACVRPVSTSSTLLDTKGGMPTLSGIVPKYRLQAKERPLLYTRHAECSDGTVYTLLGGAFSTTMLDCTGDVDMYIARDFL